MGSSPFTRTRAGLFGPAFRVPGRRDSGRSARIPHVTLTPPPLSSGEGLAAEAACSPSAQSLRSKVFIISITLILEIIPHIVVINIRELSVKTVIII